MAIPSINDRHYCRVSLIERFEDSIGGADDEARWCDSVEPERRVELSLHLVTRRWDQARGTPRSSSTLLAV